MNADVYQHFRKDEHPFIDLIEDWLETVERQYAALTTDFLNPREMFIMESIVRKRSDSFVRYFGGYSQAENQRAVIYPSYYEPTETDFQISLFEINYPKKFGELRHGDILGSILATGIQRKYLGDIISDDAGRWQFYLDKSMGNYLMTQLDKIGKFPIRLEEMTLDDHIQPLDCWEEEFQIISSMRIDVLLSAVYNISRQRSKKLIETGKVKINWQVIDQADFLVELLDIISVRGFGRMRIQAIEGKTKKEKIKVQMGILRK